MSGERIPVAIIGAGGFGKGALGALAASDVVKVVGVADKDLAVAEEAAAGASVPAYDDNRSLLAETRPRIVYLAVPPMAAPDIVSLCADRQIHVWKVPPLGRRLGEGVAMVTRMEQARLKFAIGTQRRFAGGYRKTFDLLGSLGEVVLARAHYLFNWGPNLGWRGDKASAGGGALLELGYHLIDLLVWMLGLPEEVYGVTAISGAKDRRAPDGKLQPIYDTDDTAAAILRYSSGLTATMVTSRCSGPVSEELALYGRGGSISATAESCLLRDPDGNVLQNVQDRSVPMHLFRLQAEAFARAVLADAAIYECSARENLLNLAVTEGIYLSQRTNQPEHPLHLLRTHGLSGDQCLINRPAGPAPVVPKPHHNDEPPLVQLR